MKNKIAVWFATVFGIGYLPKAPGTWGSLFAFGLYLLFPNFNYGFLVFGLLILGSIIAVFICSEAEKKLGHDNGKIIIDELFGYFFAILFIPKSLLIGFLGFLLFRIFDIFKPFPINKLQNLPKGWGVMADDILAGIFSNIILLAVYYSFLK